MTTLNAADLQATMAKYKTGFDLAPKYKAEDRTKSQRLPKPTKCDLVENVAAVLTNHMQAICPITGLVIHVNFPAKPGYFMEAYHPIVHNCKAMVKDSTYAPMLDKEQRVGLILASLHFYGLLSLESPALVVNMAMQSALNDNQLLQFLSFIRDGVCCTSKGYPVLSISASCTEQTFLAYMAKCDEIEHTNYEPATLDSMDEVTRKLFEVPKFLASDKRGSAMDKEAYENWLEIVSEDILPASLVAKAAPFAKTLVTNPSETIINKLLDAVVAKAMYEVAASSGFKAEVLVNDFIKHVKDCREVAANLKLYPDLSNDKFDADDKPTEQVVEAKQLSPFEARLAAMKAKGKI